MKQIDFKDYVEHPDKFYILDDNLIWRFEHKILVRIRERKFYKHIEDIEIDKCKEKIDKIIDSIPHNINEQCPVCYKDLTIRYAYICDDSRHKLCCYCYHNISLNLDVICPICRQNSSDSI